MTGREEEATQVFTFMEMADRGGLEPPLYGFGGQANSRYLTSL